jgi:hypothetical protein
MSAIKKAEEPMTTGWQKTADKIIKSLFLENDEAIVGNKLT